MQKFKLLYLLSIALLALSCGSKYDGFVLRGTIASADSTRLYLSYADSTGKNVVDSTYLISDKFEFKGMIKEPTMATFTLGSLPATTENSEIYLYIEPTEMTFKAENAADITKYTLTGSLSNETFKKYIAPQFEIRDQMIVLMEKQGEAADEAERAKLGEEIMALYRKSKDFDITFVKANPNSVVSAFVLQMSVPTASYHLADSLYSSFSIEVKNSSLGKKVAKDLERKLKGEPGQKANLFVATDINGKELNLSELNKDHYILVEFWASWCGACRAGMPHIKEVYNKYKSKGLMVVCVADNDTAQDEWRKAIEADGTQMFKHVLRGKKRNTDGTYDTSNDISEMFGNSLLPTQYLIDKTGTIAFKIISNNEELDSKLKDLFGE